MSSTSPTHAAPGPANLFPAALAAGLPATHDWSFPSIVGVSGGADSVALLLGLVRLEPAAAGRRLVVAHADHGLRVESAADLAFVAELARNLGLRFVSRRLTLAASGGGEGLEARARRLRYAFLAEAAHELGARHVLVAHTADDQAETILHRILRGTGVAGLAGMRRSRCLADGVALVRPLLEVPREAARAFLEAVGQDWREDASNADLGRARNFLRHEILPRCTSGPYPAAAASIVRLGGQAATAAAALASAAEHLLDRHAEARADGSLVLRTRELVGLHPHLLGELFAAIWRRQGWPRQEMTAAHYASLAPLAISWAAGGADAGRQQDRHYPGGIAVRPLGPGRILLSRH
jgi:tRNA(Ile)-lysidine synthase